MAAVETINKGKFEAQIFQDEDASSPREWDNLGIIHYRHRNYELGEKVISNDFEGSLEEYKDVLIKEFDAVITIPLYLYDHSGITIATKPFGCRWDSSEIGYIIATKNAILETFGVTELTDELIKKAEEILQDEIDTFNKYLTGKVYGYEIKEKKQIQVIKKEITGELISDEIVEIKKYVDSCWGIYGFEEIKTEVESILEKMK